MKLPYISILFGIIFLGGVYGLGYMHEQVHVQIYDMYGIDSEIKMFYSLDKSLTIPERNCPNDTCRLSHSINEAITYPLMFLYFLIGIGFLFLMFMKELEWMDKDDGET